MGSDLLVEDKTSDLLLVIDKLYHTKVYRVHLAVRGRETNNFKEDTDCISRWKGLVFNATFNNISVISWRSVLLVAETGEYLEKPPTCRKSLTTFITLGCIKYSSSERDTNSQR